MFVLVALLLLLASAGAKQDCPVCRDHSGYSSHSFSSQERDSCSRAIRSTSNMPCREGEACKVFNAGMTSSVGQMGSIGYSYFSVSIKKIGCYHPSDSCMSEFGPSFQCTESYLFNPDRCPGCMIAEATIGGVDYAVEDTCNYDSSQWGSCNRGTSCNFLKLYGYLGSNYADTFTIYILGCGLTYSDCREAENSLESGLRVSYCTANDFPDEWNP